jgi:O-antigen/teichoic acid export membrane protein
MVRLVVNRIHERSIMNVTLIGISNLIAGVVGGIFWLTIASISATHQYGELNYLLSLATILSSGSLLGLNLTLMAYLPKGNVKLAQQAKLVVLIANCIIVTSWILITYNSVVGFLIVGMSLFTMTVAEASGRKQYKRFSALVIGQRGGQFALSILLYFYLGINGIIIGYAVSSLIFGIIFFKGLLKRSILSGHIKGDLHSQSSGERTERQQSLFSELGPKYRSILHTYSIGITQSLTMNLDKLIIGPLFGFTVLGLYQIGFQFLMFLAIIPISLTQYLLPLESSGNSTNRVRRIGLALAVIMAIILYLTADIIVQLLFPHYSDATGSIKIMAFGIVPLTVNSIISAKLLGSDRTRPIVLSSAAYLLSLFSLLLSIGQMFGINGLAFSVVVSITIQSLVLWILSRLIR